MILCLQIRVWRLLGIWLYILSPSAGREGLCVPLPEGAFGVEKRRTHIPYLGRKDSSKLL